MIKHRRKVVWIEGRRCLIDRDIAPLIEKLNALGIRTVNSCQDSCGGWCNKKHRTRMCRGVVWICFASTDDAKAFLDVCRRQGDAAELHDCMFGYGPSPPRWIWNIYFDGEFDTSYTSCVFPRKHLSLVLERVIATQEG